MGQLVAVTEKPTASPGVARFELNRALTGMGHEHFESAADAFGPRPAAELARRLFGTGQVAAVHVYSNIVTVDLAKGGSTSGLADVDAQPVPLLAVRGCSRRRSTTSPTRPSPEVTPPRRRPTTAATRPWPRRPSGSRCTCSSAAGRRRERWKAKNA